MIIEELQHWMDVRGVNQTRLCTDLGISIPNYNAFLHGKRIIQCNKLARIMDYLRVTFAKNGQTLDYRPKDMSMFFLAITKGQGIRISELAERMGCSPCSLSSFINGNRSLSFRILDRMCETLGVQIVSMKNIKKYPSWRKHYICHSNISGLI